jgi:hypothetical protein
MANGLKKETVASLVAAKKHFDKAAEQKALGDAIMKDKELKKELDNYIALKGEGSHPSHNVKVIVVKSKPTLRWRLWIDFLMTKVPSAILKKEKNYYSESVLKFKEIETEE